MRALVAIAAVLVAAAPAAADDGAASLGKAQKAIDDVDYETARTLTAQALASGTLRAADLARAHMLAGEVAAALGDDAGAHDHFERWILLVPDAKLPDGLSPKITQPFTAARASADALGPARFDVTLTRAGDRVDVFVAGDPLRMAVRARVMIDGAPAATTTAPKGDVPAPAGGGAIHATIDLLDDHGNQLAAREAQTGIDTQATHLETLDDRPAIVVHSVPAAVRWPTWTVLAVVAGGATAYFAHAESKDQSDLDALNASSAMHTFDEAKAIQDRGQRDALLTNVSLVTAGAALAAAVITFAIDEKTVEVQPIAAPGVAGASATLHF